MNLRSSLASLALGMVLVSPLPAQTAAPSPKSDLQALVGQIQSKLKAGQKSAADLAPELAGFDELLKNYEGQKTDEVARIAFMKADLYAKVLNDRDSAKKTVEMILAQFPDTPTAAKLKLAMPAPAPAGGEGLAAGSGDPMKLTSGQVWMTDWVAAKALAAKEGKKLILDFTGSDWCGYCIKLDNEVFATDEFAKFAKDYVLVKLDYPRKKALPEAEVEQNKTLKGEFSIRGYPTIVVTDSAGTELSRTTGYAPGSGTESFVAKLTGSGT